MNTSQRIVTLLAMPLSLLPGTGLSQTGTVRGTVLIDGVPPAPRVLQVTTDQGVCGTQLRARDLVVANGRVAFAVAYVEGVSGAVTVDEHLLSNTDCLFDPPVIAAAVGGTLLIDNQDNVLHNTHLTLWYSERSKRTVGNSALPRKGMVIRSSRALRQSGVIDVDCDAHPWMHAKLWVFDHPYFAVSDTAGTFEIRGLPVGTHTLKVWHQVLGEEEQQVEVRADQVSSAEVVYRGDSRSP